MRQIYRPKRTFQFDPFLSDGSPDAKSASILLRSLVASTTDGGASVKWTLSTCGDSSLSKNSTFATLVKACSLSPHEVYRPHSHTLELGEGWVTGSLHKSRQFLSPCGGNCVFLPSWECSTPPTLDLPFTFMSMLHAMSGRFHIEGPTVGQLIELHGHWRTTALFTGRHAPAPHKSPQALRLMLHPCCRLTCPESRKGANAVIETFIQYPYALTNWTIGLWMSNFFGLAHITTLHSLLQFGNVSKVAVSPGH